VTLLATRVRTEVATDSEDRPSVTVDEYGVRHGFLTPAGYVRSPEQAAIVAVPMPELGSGAIDGGRVRHMLSQARAHRADRVSLEGKRAVAHRTMRCALSTCREPLVKAPEEAWSAYRVRRCCNNACKHAYKIERYAARRRAMIEESEG
jgi:hypothetical protein